MNKLIAGFSLCLIFVAQAPLSAAVSASDLLANSPFVPEGWSPSGKNSKADSAQQYVFRGVYSIDGVFSISITNNTTGKSVWVEIGQTKDDIKAISYDATAKKATISIGSREMTLELAKAKSNAGTVGLAVNSQAGGAANKTQAALARKNNKRMMPPPPPEWVLKRSSKMREKAQSGGGVNSSSSSSSSSSDSTSTVTPTNPSSDTDTADTTETKTPTNTDDPDDDDTPIDAPPAPPDFVPSIPDSLKDLIDKGPPDFVPSIPDSLKDLIDKGTAPEE